MQGWRRYLPIYLRVCRAVSLYLVFLLLWCLTNLFFGTSTIGPDSEYYHLPAKIRALFVPFLFFSVARVFAENDGLTPTLYEGEQEGELARCLCVLRSRLYWLELGALLTLPILLPIECGFYHLRYAFFGGITNRALAKLVTLSVSLPVLALLHLWARLSALQKHSDALRATGMGQEEAITAYRANVSPRFGVGVAAAPPQKEERRAAFETYHRRFGRPREGMLKFVGKVLALFPIYMFGGWAFSWFLPVFLSLFGILRALRYLRWWLPIFAIGGLILGFWGILLLRALRIRRRFIKSLKKCCREYGFTLGKLHRPYLSLIWLRDGVNFTLQANGRTYACKLFGALRRHCPLFFSEEGVLYCTHSFRFRRVEMFRYTTQYRFDFAADGSKICIVAPVPKVIYSGNDSWHRPIDTGMRAGEYRIFSSTGFLNALRRDCVERD